ncbi:MAG: ankyrin repeat domain-containing protein [Sulfolobaceae archaeon]
MVRTTNWNGELLEVTRNGDLIKVQTALEKGANPNAKNKYGSTPLHYAAYFGHVDVVKILPKRGADPRSADNDGLIPLDYAKDSAIRSLLESAMRNSYSEVPREPRIAKIRVTVKMDNS